MSITELNFHGVILTYNVFWITLRHFKDVPHAGLNCCVTLVLCLYIVDELQYQSDGDIWNQGQPTGHVWGGQETSASAFVSYKATLSL